MMIMFFLALKNCPATYLQWSDDSLLHNQPKLLAGVSSLQRSKDGLSICVTYSIPMTLLIVYFFNLWSLLIFNTLFFKCSLLLNRFVWLSAEWRQKIQCLKFGLQYYLFFSFWLKMFIRCQISNVACAAGLQSPRTPRFLKKWIIYCANTTLNFFKLSLIVKIENLLKVLQSFYVDSRACVGVWFDVSELFLVNVRLRQGCVVSPWLLNECMDSVVWDVNARVLGKRLELLSVNGRRFEINQLLFADDVSLVADSEEKLCRLVSEVGRVCERRKWRVNVIKSKVVRCSRYGNEGQIHVRLNCEPLGEADCFKYPCRKWQWMEVVKGV